MNSQGNPKSELNPDREVSNREEDLLDRYPIAEEFARRIENLPMKEGSYVIGIEGEWGSGKSSFINFIRTALTDRKSDVVLYEFSPWRFSSEDDLVKNFFKDLSSIHAENLITNKFLEAWQKFEEILTATKSERNKLTADPNLLGGAAFIASALTGQFPLLRTVTTEYSPLVLGLLGTVFWGFSFWKRYKQHEKAQKEKRTLDQQKKELAKETASWPSKLLIVLDDIDRLTPSEIRAVIKLVKSQCDLPNIVYLLSYDKRQIASAYKDIKKNSEKFLDKIVQYEHRLPPLSLRQAQGFFYGLLEKHFSLSTHEFDRLVHFLKIDLNPYGFNKNNEPSVSEQIFQLYLCNFREIVRFMNTLTFSASSYFHNGWFERDISDFVCIELLKHYEPAVHSYVANNKRLFVTGERADSIHQNDRIADLKKAIESKAVASCAVEVVAHVFSRLKNQGGGELGIRAEYPGYFDSYFQMTHPKERVLKSTLIELIKDAKVDYEGAITKIKAYADDGVSLALQIRDEFGSVEEVECEGAYQFLLALVMAAPKIHSKSPEWFLTYVSVQRQQEDQTAVFNLIRMFIQESRSIDASAWLLQNLDEMMSEQTKISAYTLLLEWVAMADKKMLLAGSSLSFLQPILETKMPTRLVEFFKTNLRRSPFIMSAFFGRNAKNAQNAEWIVKNVSPRVINKWLNQVESMLSTDSLWGRSELLESKQLIEAAMNKSTAA